MNDKYNLSPKLIFEKEFNIDIKGYATNEVDAFLDLVIEDYEAYTRQIRELGENLQKYEDSVKQLVAKINELEASLKFESSKPQNVDQVDVLKRISKLEEAVFKK